MRKALSTLQSDPAPSALDMVSGKVGRETGLSDSTAKAEPGLISGMVSMGSSMAHPGIDLETGKSKSKMGVAGDAAMLALPSALGMEGRSVLDAGQRYYQGTKAAVRDTKSFRDAATLPVRAYRNVKDALPSSNKAAVEEFLPKGEPYKPAAPIINNGADLIDKYLPKVKAAEMPKPPMAKAPTLDEALQTALEQNMGPDPARASTSADVVPTGGAQKPKVGKRPGGYTTDIPARPGYEAPAEVAPVERRASMGKSAKLADTSAGTDSLEELLNAIHGEDSPLAINPEGHGTKPSFNASEVSGIQRKTGQMLPSQDLAEEAASLRRAKGSRDAGSELFPDLAPADRGGLVKKLAPGPSQVPLEAEARINAAAQKAKGMDIPSLLLAMLTGGGGALATRQTTPNSTMGLPE